MWVRTDWAVDSGANATMGWGPNVNQQRWHFKFEAGSGALRTENQGGNNIAGIAVNDGQWHHVASVFPEGGSVIGDVDHYVDGVLDTTKEGGVDNPIDTNVDPAVAPEVMVGGAAFNNGFRFTIAAIDDVRIYNRALNAEEITALAAGQGVRSGSAPRIGLPEGIRGATFYSAAEGLPVTVAAVGDVTVSADQVSMTVNGEDVTDQLTSSGSDTELEVQFDGLEDNRSYQVDVTASDSDEITSTRRFSFSTFREDNFIIEAENYNFDGGQFIDDPVLCNTLGGEPDCYFDKISQPGVDSFDSMGHSDDSNQFDEVYRFAAEGAERVEEFDTLVSSDVLRDKYDGVQGASGPVLDYDINLLNAGDWANYTRTFPDQPGYRVFLRVQAQAEQNVRLDLVTSDPSAADQTVELLGYFKAPAASEYAFVPLTDLAGENELSVILSGEQTLRLTAEQAEADININYMMFVPTEETSVLPSAIIQSPADGSVFANNADITLTAEASDEDGTVSNVIFTAEKDGEETVIGEVAGEPYEVVWSGVAPGIYTVTAEAVDNDGLSGMSAPITIIVDSDPPEIVEVRSSPSLDAIEVIFNEPVDPATGENTAHYTLDPSLTINAAVTDGRKVMLTTAPQTVGTDYSLAIQNVEDRHGNAVTADPVAFTASDSNLFFGLELYLTFDEGSGAVVQDLSGYDRDGRIVDDPLFVDASVLWTEGNFGGAVELDNT
jgi:hypothetical protein